ncbi:hypothetical protein CTI12_AA253930 [Artemisia annua]|uniref:Uncharacterized protein n=1 Tax=Artemisia annua TaxID=35608 RepID=A0A2U1NL86_ARTAN|nr:hypothetical protein CTI12_AA253930 [Artemisia annua]
MWVGICELPFHPISSGVVGGVGGTKSTVGSRRTEETTMFAIGSYSGKPKVIDGHSRGLFWAWTSKTLGVVPNRIVVSLFYLSAEGRILTVVILVEVKKHVSSCLHTRY